MGRKGAPVWTAPAAMLVAVTLWASGCGTSEASAQELFGPDTWELTSSSVDGEPIAVSQGARVTVLLSQDGKGIGGTAACNGYGATVEVSGGSMTIGVEGQTEMGCEPDVMAAEAAFLGALPRVTTGERDGSTLRLTGEGVELGFTSQPPVPVADLVGTTWVLESLVDGETGSSVSGDPATLRLDDDGSVTGSTGCRPLSGTYVIHDEVLFPSFGLDATECPAELAAQDSHVVEVLGDGFLVEIDGDTLTASKPYGRGLVYRKG